MIELRRRAARERRPSRRSRRHEESAWRRTRRGPAGRAMKSFLSFSECTDTRSSPIRIARAHSPLTRTIRIAMSITSAWTDSDGRFPRPSSCDWPSVKRVAAPSAGGKYRLARLHRADVLRAAGVHRRRRRAAPGIAAPPARHRRRAGAAAAAPAAAPAAADEPERCPPPADCDREGAAAWRAARDAAAPLVRAWEERVRAEVFPRRGASRGARARARAARGVGGGEARARDRRGARQLRCRRRARGGAPRRPRRVRGARPRGRLRASTTSARSAATRCR